MVHSFRFIRLALNEKASRVINDGWFIHIRRQSGTGETTISFRVLAESIVMANCISDDLSIVASLTLVINIKYSLPSSLSSRCFTLPSRLFLNIPTTTACEQTIKSIFELDSNFSGKEFQVVNLHRRTRQKFLLFYWLSGIPFHLFLPSHLPLYLSLNQWNSSFLD